MNVLLLPFKIVRTMLFGKKKPSTRKPPTLKDITTVIFATTAAMFLLLLAGLSLAGTAIAFTAAMPLFVVFSPVLVPAGITATVLGSGFMASEGAGATVLAIIMWLYKQVTGNQPLNTLKKLVPTNTNKMLDMPRENKPPPEKPGAKKPKRPPPAEKLPSKPAPPPPDTRPVHKYPPPPPDKPTAKPPPPKKPTDKPSAPS